MADQNQNITQSVSSNVPARKTSIVFVDDDQFLLDMYALKFSNSNYDVRSVQGPEEALKILRDIPSPDILVMDVVMPGMDGFQLLESLRKEHLVEMSVVIMLTNQGASEDITRAKKLNIDGYIVKAVTIPSEVLSEVNKIYSTSSKKK